MDPQKEKLSRRSFLKVAGAGLAFGLGGTLASGCVPPAPPAAPQAPAAGLEPL